MSTLAHLQCCRVTVSEILALRAHMLRTGQPLESAKFPEDDFESTLHFAAYCPNKATEIRPANNRFMKNRLTDSPDTLDTDNPEKDIQPGGDESGDWKNRESGHRKTELAGCLTLIRNPDEEIPTWQLRGMATAEAWQGKGIGRALLTYAEACLHTRYPEIVIWCNARVHAASFYQLMGYDIISGIFNIEGVGLHYKMEKKIL